MAVKVSRRTEYGLRAMVALAELAGDRRPVSLPTIAEMEEIPEQFLDQIVVKLRKAGFVKSVRGVNGGYLLARPADEISVGALVRLLEGSLAPIECIGEGVTDPGAVCGRARGCHTRSVWLRVMEALTEALDSITLADVMRDEVPAPEASR
ncbi:RrF2 family transcriptional regulator [Alicyclobacillus macrosporangiidus]|uniref:Rrf2 family protein n=1 Tax=Alicyclobacillus macrosporangiidus TaxID=392015 RepID=A0A1I7FKI6_9BACL|nr:Rrf2 family transcriptional regulator [Alicyclobacillus macrosporangiidus]SFU36693.1 Rrf2 family protein [Alicyclobacillus macrosporangiidus]